MRKGCFFDFASTQFQRYGDSQTDRRREAATKTVRGDHKKGAGAGARMTAENPEKIT
ncbi:MAG: hypothetical protein J6T60_04320 [Bacteroidales bacterium]|nr:hypothetical protein [Bacteroidales bacterium]